METDFEAMDWAAPTDTLPAAEEWVPFPEAGSASTEACPSRPYRPSMLLRPEAEARRRQFYRAVTEVACAEGVPVGLVDAVLIQESGYNPFALSPKGAFGLGQLMPGTARNLGVDRFDTRANLRGAVRYLRQLLIQFGEVHLALAAYNAGPERVRVARGLPPIRETLTYVRRVLVNWSALETGDIVPGAIQR